MALEAKPVPSPGSGDESGKATWRRRVLTIPSVVLDSAIGVLMLAVALWFWFGAASIQTRSPFSLVGPAAFPRAISALLAVCSLLFIGRSVASRLRTGISTKIAIDKPAHVFVAMALVVVYPLLIDTLRYYIATGLWLPVFLWVSGYKRPLGIVLVSIGFLVFTKIIFDKILGTPLP